MRRVAAAALTAAAFAFPGVAVAAPIHTGQHGTRVAGLQWMLGGHKPSAYHGIATFHAPVNGWYGARTKSAVLRMKVRLGFPKRALTTVAGDDFLEIIRGDIPRPVGYIARASARLNTVSTIRSACASRVVKVAEGEVGVREIPDGSNTGPRVAVFQQVTGAYHAAWCASFVQWDLKTAGYGTIADRSAGVFYIRDYAYKHGELRAIPKPGSLVAFLNDLGHIGVVETVTAHGFYSIEGNYANAVTRVFHNVGEVPMVFIYLPGCV